MEGYSDYAYIAEVDGQLQEFVSPEEYAEYIASG